MLKNSRIGYKKQKDGVHLEEKKIKSDAYYLDDDHNIVDPDNATMVVLHQYDENGNMISETFGFTERQLRKKMNLESEEASIKRSWIKRLIGKVFIWLMLPKKN